MKLLQHIIGYSLPLWLALLCVGWYGHWDFSQRQLLKDSGLLGMTLFAFTFLIGPINKFWVRLEGWKIFRKYWGITATVVIAVHMVLAFYTVYKSSLSRMFSTDFSGVYGHYHVGFWFGFVAFLYFVFMVAISNRFAMAKLGHRWKILQTIGYVAFGSALVHFILLETDPKLGFVIKKPLGRMVFALAIVVLVLRLYVWLWTKFTRTPDNIPPAETAQS